MTDLGIWEAEFKAQFDGIVESLRAVSKADRSTTKERVEAHVVERGSLSRSDAQEISAQTGWSTRTLWRWAAEFKSADAPTAVHGTFLDKIAADGPAGFEFDELALTLLYMCGGNRRRFRQELMDAGFEMPSEPTLCRMWNRLSKAVRDGVTNGHRNRYRNLLYIRKGRELEANNTWQIDDFDLDLRVLVNDRADAAPNLVTGEVEVAEDEWVGRRPHLTLLIDDHSSFIPGWILLDRHPTAADVKALFADAFEVRPAENDEGTIGGLCSQVICDNASSFTAFVAEEMFTSMAVSVRPAPAYSPESKARVERAGQTIQSLLITGLAGIVTAAERVNKTHLFDVPSQHWLEFEHLEALCAKVIFDYNYTRPHIGIGGKVPAELYVASNVHPRIAADSDLADMYVPVRHGAGRRVVQPTGIQVLGQYWLALELEPWIGKTVETRRLHHRLDRIAVFDTDNNFICMAVPSTEIDAAKSGLFVERRKDSDFDVNRHAARAREAMMLRTDAIATGGDATMLTAAKTALAERAARAEVTPTSATLTAPKSSPKKASAKKAPGGTRPEKRNSPKTRKSTAGVPAALSQATPLDVAEAAALASIRTEDEPF